ncbi:MAG TPA: peptide ABC transporter substrate-binding protein [Roseiflexaceae bacterium]|nr:peptide ABC transporter substrate-binding protein [Roseiflexaceae bacterium]
MTLLLRSRSLRSLCGLTCLSILLAACAIEGGVPPATPVPVAPTFGPAPTDAAVAAAAAARDNTWAIGLLDQPRDLYPYAQDAPSQRIAAPLNELLFPSPVLALNYTYTSTGVLERIPSLENGDAQLGKTDVYLDAANNITTTVTEVITQVDQLVVTFHWNPRLSWSDGQPLTADDSVFAYELAKAAPPNDEARDRLAQLVAYERVDDHTTRATLRPDLITPSFFLTYWTPLPRHLLKDVDPAKVRESDFARKPIGYGPYAIESRDDHTITMVRNEHYFGPPPAAKNLTLTFVPNVDVLHANLVNGNLDVVTTDRPQADQLATFDQDQQAGRLRVVYIPNPIWEHIDFNLDVPQLQDIRLRRAIALGANRQAMADKLFGGHTPVLSSWVLPGQAEAAPPDQLTRYDYNPDEARKLLDEAGYGDPDGDGIRASPDGLTLTFQLLTTDGAPVRQQIAEMFQQDMKAIGVDVQPLLVPAAQLFAPDGPLFQRQFDLALFGWIAGVDPGGLQLWGCDAVPSPENGWAGNNFAGWCFRDANRAIREAVTTVDAEQRRAAYARQQQLWTQEMPSLPLFSRLSLALIAAPVRGPQPDPLAPITWNVATWTREK